MNYFITLAAGSMGGWVFSLVHTPLPWTLGPLVAIVIVKAGFRYSVAWPAQIRNIAMIVLGYAMGRSFTPETGIRILGLLPYLVIATLISVALSLLGGVLTSRYTGVNLTTSLFGSIPGGLSQMAAICENIQEADVSAITLMQTIRMLVVVFLVPFIALHGLSRNAAPPEPVMASLGVHDVLQLALFTGVIAALIYLSKFLKLTGRYVILPIIGTGVLVLSGMNAPPLPSSIIKIAQVFVGIRMGMGVNAADLGNWKKVSLFSILSNMGLLVTLFGLDYVMAQIAPISFVTGFIATAPGGMTEMGLTAMTVKADLSTVISFQLFRLLFVLLVTIPAVSWWLRRHSKRFEKKCYEAGP